jgi:hypothetical protein
MGEQEVLAKRLFAEAHHGPHRSAGKFGIRRPFLRMEGERNESRLDPGHGHAELLGDLVTERRRADLRDGDAAAGDDQRFGAEFAARCGDKEPAPLP